MSSFIADKVVMDGLTYDDVLLIPAYSEVLPRTVSLTTKFSRNIELKVPFVTAAMDTVTEASMAIAIAREGGIGVIHKNMSIEEQARQAGVNGFMTKPVFMSTLCRALQKYVLGEVAVDEQKSKTDFSGKRFLLVEDNALNREIAVEMLESTGAVVESAFDGAEGAAKFAAAPAGYYDLLLMDVQMPVMNGYEATQKIRASAKTDARTVPIVAMTADAFAEDIIEAKKAGMNSHLAKPLNLATLVREINKQLQKH